jgi:lipopolysaccharide/colanic/teichoic acid biosynthesis glycosyltransferase
VVAAGAGLAVLSPLLLLVAVAVRLESPGPAVFRQRRIGRRFRPFTIYKFRTMIDGAVRRGLPVTAGADARVTRVGRVLRKTKLDELPQLFNVLRGDMSLVGPRPEVPRYVALFRREYGPILEVRPGITDLASIAYCDEEAVLGHATDAEREYVRCVLPDKIRLAREYLRRRSMRFDLYLIAKTIGRLLHSGARREAAAARSYLPAPPEGSAL